MKLIFYSKLNKKVDLEFIKLLKSKNPKIGYIPSTSNKGLFYFQQIRNYYNKYNLKDFYYFDLDKHYERKKIIKILDCDAVILSGGNTFYFLWLIRKRKVESLLRKFLGKGGILVGISAGGIIMTPCINTASIPRYDSDENKINLQNLKSLNLVKFEFLPHFRQDQKYLKEVITYSKTTSNPIYACSDRSGIVVKNRKISFINRVFRFQNGEMKEIK